MGLELILVREFKQEILENMKYGEYVTKDQIVKCLNITWDLCNKLLYILEKQQMEEGQYSVRRIKKKKMSKIIIVKN